MKPATKEVWSQAMRNPKDHFGNDRELASIAEGDGEDLKQFLLKQELKSYSAARSDLQASLKRAPTGIAYQKLGEIEEASNKCREAMGYYKQALNASGGQNAELQNKLAALQLSCRPF